MLGRRFWICSLLFGFLFSEIHASNDFCGKIVRSPEHSDPGGSFDRIARSFMDKVAHQVVSELLELEIPKSAYDMYGALPEEEVFDFLMSVQEVTKSVDWNDLPSILKVFLNPEKQAMDHVGIEIALSGHIFAATVQNPAQNLALETSSRVFKALQHLRNHGTSVEREVSSKILQFKDEKSS